MYYVGICIIYIQRICASQRPTHRSARPQSWEGDVKLLKGVTCATAGEPRGKHRWNTWENMVKTMRIEDRKTYQSYNHGILVE